MVKDGVTTNYTFDEGKRWRTQQGPIANPDETVFQYNGTGRLLSYANETTGTSATYEYDAVGQRTKSVVTLGGTGGQETTTDFTYAGLTLHKLSATQTGGIGSPSWTITYLYDEYGKPYAGVYRDTTSTETPPAPVVFGMITTDRGDVVELLDKDGEPFAAYRYDAWGNPLGAGTDGAVGMWWKTTTAITDVNVAKAIAQRQVLRYAGYCYDSESGMYYLSARHYDPVTRQFLSKDLSRNDGEQSAYQYCGGNPVANVDPTGLKAESPWTSFWDRVKGRHNPRDFGGKWRFNMNVGIRYTQQEYAAFTTGKDYKTVKAFNKSLTHALKNGQAVRTDRARYYVQGFEVPSLTDAEAAVERNEGTVDMLRKAMKEKGVFDYASKAKFVVPLAYRFPVKATARVFEELIDYCEVSKYAESAVAWKQGSVQTPLLAALDYVGPDDVKPQLEGYHKSDQVLMWVTEQWAKAGWQQQ
jgi:RHS repeat-associated protein